jgi:hypothetical protein
MVMFFIRAKRAATAEARRRLVLELAAVIFQLFSLSLFSGTCLLLFVSVLKFWTAK